MDQAGRSRHDRRKADRHTSGAAAIARVPASPHRAQIADFSATGCRVRFADPFAVPVGSTIHLDFGPGRRMSGQVMWSSSQAVGVRFARALPASLAAVLAGEEAAVEVEPEKLPEYEIDPARFALHHWFRRLFGKAA